MKTHFFPFNLISGLSNLSHHKHDGLALIIFLMGSFLSFITFHYYQIEDYNHKRLEFNHLADIRLYIIQEIIEGTIEQLEYIKQFYYASDHVSKLDFHIFVQNSLNLYPNLMALGWISYQGAESSPSAQKPHLNFIPLNSAILKAKNHYTFPFDYLELAHPSHPFYLDVHAYSEFKKLLKQAVDYSSIRASDAVDFFQKKHESGFFLFDPVFLGNGALSKKGDNESALRGIVVAFSNFETIVQGVSIHTEPIAIHIAIYENQDDLKNLLYQTPSVLSSGKSMKPTQTQELWLRSHTFDIGNRSWTIEATPTQHFIDQRRKWGHWEVPFIGVLLSALSSLYFLALVNRGRFIKQEVQKRTEELAESNRLLQQEVRERQRIEEDFIRRQRYLQKRHEALQYLTKFTTSELKSALQEVLLRTALVLQVDRVSIWFYEVEQQPAVLSCAGLYHFSTNSFSDHLEFSSTSFPHYFRALTQQSHLVIPSVDNPELNQELASYLSTFHIVSKLDVPIVFEGKLLGVLCCEETRGQREWQLEDRHFGQTIADIISIMVEQSARRKMEVALQESEERLRFITQKAIDAIISVTDKSEIVSWNYGAEQMFGYSEIEILGKPLGLILPQQNVQQLEQTTKPVEMRGQHQDGRIFPVELSHTRWKSGYFYFDTVIIRDITERKEYEKRLIKAMKEAKAANQAKSEFLTTISHELRTPLNAIIGFDQCLLMEMDGAINDQQRISLKKIEKSSFHLLSLINNLLDLAKIEANKMELDIALQNIVELVKACVEEMQPLARQKGLEIHLLMSKSPILMEIDKIRIKQVLLNLLGNAIKFTEKGFIRLTLLNHPYTVEIQITDTGIGLSSEEIAKIFKPFSQADSSITRKYGGTGLGLAISKKIMDIHGGTLSVQSQKGKGSTFILIIPKGQ